MRKIVTLKQIGHPVQAKKMYLPYGDQSPWWIHRLSDETNTFEHWSKEYVLHQGVRELILMRIGKKKGVQISRMVKITA